jgi:hypothetical protein
MNEATSPAASGPAGGHFEGQVGASYLLSMLVAAEARGLPGTTIDRVAFQRAAEGHPLDDVIVYAHDAQGNPATLEVQVKRTVTFAPGDEVFRSVVRQIAAVSKKPEFMTTRYELGVAISRSSYKIDGPYKDVLTWARQLGAADTFIKRINRAGSANDDMRSFVETFRTHLKDADASHDDEAVWQLLRRLHILTFDFTATGSASEELAKERAVRALHQEDGLRATDLWKGLTELAIDIAKSGGDRSRKQLIADLNERGFRLAGDRHNLAARQALADASRNTLADIGDRIAGVMLTRHERVGAVQKALDEGRYVEIRGNAGVGKSGVLKHFAQQISSEAAVVALSPARTLPKGLLSLLSVIRFDGSSHDLLSDLAGSGSAIVFVDGLDFFGPDERLTVIDLVREAATVPGMSVVVTARRDFGVAEPNWLPEEVLDKLGRAEPIIIEELSDNEADELRSAAPQLSALLSDDHPAKEVAHNLFRLSRLANRPSGAPALRTEAEMAEDWWQSADGARDPGHRDRARVLKALAEQALSRADHLTVSGMPSPAVDALVSSESLRDLGGDRVVFRHDVLREWAIANLLFSDPARVDQLPLDRPAPADLSRGAEVAARLAIERTPDAARWQALCAAVTKTGFNESWGRAVMLALVRSEIAIEMLDKASAVLFADRAKMLRELIRIVSAVESEPAGKYYAAAGIDPSKIPAGIMVPSGPSWGKLILWLLKIGVGVPAPAILDVVSLYTNWSIVFGGKGPFTTPMVQWFYHWLSQIDTPRENVSADKRAQPFHGELTSKEIGMLAEELRTGFLLFCNHTPTLAAQYLQSAGKHPYRDQALRALLKFRGSLAQAAPKELAELTADYLMPKEDEDEDDHRGPFREAFGHRDIDFVPVSPVQGPFYDLLLHAPEHGLSLIRRIVDHAVAFQSGGREFGDDAMTVVYPDGSEKVFSWPQTYGWSRNMGAGPSVVACALMALEAWAHGRIEKGETVDAVVSDVIGQSPTPAAYLLVVVDLLLSHWPASRTAAIPFVACPQLLCIDGQRVYADNVEIPDIFGLKEISREPSGVVSIESLKSRPSRKSSIDRLLDVYTVEDFETERTAVRNLLQQVAARLGPPQERSDLGDPEFMVLHALNRTDPGNWRKIVVQTPDGPEEDWTYLAPAAEREHLKPLRDEKQERDADFRMEGAIRIVLNDARRSSSAFAAAAVKWAQDATNKPAANETVQWMRDEAIVTAALIGTRDGGAELIAAQGDWIRETFKRAFKGKHDPVHRTRDGLQYNQIAIAFVGTALLLKNRFDMADVRTLLEAAADNPASAQGLYFVAEILAEIDERLPRAILRSAFSACVQPWRQWNRQEGEHKAQLDARQREVAGAIEAELSWLSGKWGEPAWPAFEQLQVHSRHRYSLGGQRRDRQERDERPELYTDHQAAALWLRKAAKIFDVVKRPWLRELAKTHSNWTAVANGSGMEADDEPERTPHEWNNAYFDLLARCLPGLTVSEIDELALGLILGLPGEAFLDVMTIFLRSVDNVYFTGTALGDTEAVHIRTALARRLMTSRQWEWQRRDLSDSITTHLGPAIASLAFNDFGHFQPAKSYLLPKGIDRLPPFIPLLTELAESGPFLFVAMVLLNLLEVSPRTDHLGLVCAAAQKWMFAHSESREFWVGAAIGRRVCAVLTAILALDPKLFATDQPVRREIDALLGKLIRLGVAEAHRLEEALGNVR